MHYQLPILISLQDVGYEFFLLNFNSSQIRDQKAQVRKDFMPLFSFYTLWKHQKISDLLMFLGGIDRNQ